VTRHKTITTSTPNLSIKKIINQIHMLEEQIISMPRIGDMAPDLQITTVEK
jgi:hypothetical protein